MNRSLTYVILVMLQGLAEQGYGQQPNPQPYGVHNSFNLVRVWDIKRPLTNEPDVFSSLRTTQEVSQTSYYYDGLGRLIQTVQRQATPLGNDLVAPVVYDGLGRVANQYLPFAATVAASGDTTNNGNLKMDPFQEDSVFSTAEYPGQTYFYSNKNIELSPLNRLLNSYPVGNSWVGNSRGTGIQYLANTVNDSVRIWNISFTPETLPSTPGTYAAGQLYKTMTTDENNHTTVEYKDNQGLVILKKVQQTGTPGSAHSGWLNTYYVYDSLNNLRFVIPPLAVQWLLANSWSFSASGATQMANELCFRYEYDQRNRPTISKVPGAGEKWSVYDARDRVVMSQDSNMRTNHEWLYTQYDSLNREITTGVFTDNTRYDSLSYYLNQAYSSTVYPNLANFTNDTDLTMTFYDNYSWVPTWGFEVSATRISTYDNRLQSASNSVWPYIQPTIQSNQIRGLKTGEFLRLLARSGVLTATYLYDDRSRVLQKQQNSLSGQVSVFNTQFTFDGKPVTEFAFTGWPAEEMLTTNVYDAMNRLKAVYSNVDSAASNQLVDSMAYNEVGLLRAKYLGNQVDSLVYSYNIRDWLTGINKNFLTSSGSTPPNYFGMELAYDNASSVTGTSYANPTYNGNMAGTIWKSAGDEVARKYDFSYDTLNRLTGAVFNQQNGTSWSKANPDNPSTSMDFSVANLTYDANGNILSMNQQGFTFPSAGPVDQLRYTIFPNSNKLQQVYDSANNQSTLLGDFHYNSSTKTSTDYAYDGNGNLVQDNNKGITGISYNYMNLPTQIHIAGKGTITYIYDATGKKWEKIIVDSTVSPAVSTTDVYMEPVLYMGALKSILHPEGRARWVMHHNFGTTDSAYQWDYDFFERDHLGNTRIVLTQEKDTAQYMATMEAANRATEQALFYGIDSSCYRRASVSGYPDDLTVTNPNDSVARVDGNGPKEGPAIILKVMSGDKVDIGVQYYYNNMTNNNGPNLSYTDLLSSLASGLFAVAGPTHGALSSLNNPSTSPLISPLESYLSNQGTPASGKPAAYLNWMLLDDQFNYVSSFPQSGAIQVANYGTQSNGTLQPQLAQTGIPITKSGYLYIYVSNATPAWDVFFDNLSVKTYSGPLLEETHYYPFGLTMAGISDKALKGNYAENKYRWNRGSELQNKEFSDGSGLEMYETPLRSLDPQLGRWWQIDPVFTNGVDGDDEVDGVIIDGLKSQSPYASMDNNPIRLDDPKGDYTCCIVQELVAVLTGEEGPGAVATAATTGSSGSTMGPGEAIVAALNPVGAWHGMQKFWNWIHPTAPSAPTATAPPAAPSAPTATAPPQTTTQASEHTSGARNSTKGKHEKGQARKQQDREGSKGQKKWPRKRPDNWKGPYPPKDPPPPPAPAPPPPPTPTPTPSPPTPPPPPSTGQSQ
jgi:hypothetical protein